MIITELMNKFYTDIQNPASVVNGTLRYQFTYNGYTTDVFYTRQDGLQNTLRFVASVNGIDYLFVEYVSQNNGIYAMVPYIDNEIYMRFKFTLLFVNGKCITTPYFEAMIDQLLHAEPIVFPDVNRHYYRHHDSSYHPFFETTVRQRMSPAMRTRIQRSYNRELATHILNYCGNHHTLRFTDNPAKAKDIVAFMAANP